MTNSIEQISSDEFRYTFLIIITESIKAIIIISVLKEKATSRRE